VHAIRNSRQSVSSNYGADATPKWAAVVALEVDVRSTRLCQATIRASAKSSPGVRQSAERQIRSPGERKQAAKELQPVTIPSDPFHVEEVRARLAAGNGGYEIVHESPGLEVGVYVLVAPEPDTQEPHEDDELYLVLEGRGVLTVEGEAVPLAEGDAVFVPAGAAHQFTGYEGLSVLVIFAKQPGPPRSSMNFVHTPSD
jgi:mannose-6-phosphate isomerase-like protein (cupin superfamily)